jgi:hypothetical protein
MDTEPAHRQLGDVVEPLAFDLTDMFRSLSSWEPGHHAMAERAMAREVDVPATSTIDLDRPGRRRRRTRPRSQTIAMKRVSRAERAALAKQFPISDVENVPRPATRADCREQAGPCPWVACKHHLYLDINPLTGSIKINFPDLEPWELAHTCALQVAEAGALTLEQVGEITNLTRERVRQVELVGLTKLGTIAARAGLR